MCKDLEPPLISLHCAIKELEICHSFSPFLYLTVFRPTCFCVCVCQKNYSSIKRHLIRGVSTHMTKPSLNYVSSHFVTHFNKSNASISHVPIPNRIKN